MITSSNGNEGYDYDSRGNIVSKTVFGLHNYNYTYSEDSSSKLERITFNNSVINPRFDANGRNIGKRITDGEATVEDEYITYLKVGDHATNLPLTVRNKQGLTRYKYDNMGNISEVYENGKLAVRYTYDALGRRRQV